MKPNNKYMKINDKIKNHHIPSIRMLILPFGGFKWFKETCKFNEDFIKSYNNDRDEGYFLEVDVQYPEDLHKLHNDLPFLPERMKIEKSLKT